MKTASVMIAFAAVAFLSPVLEGYSLLISGGAAAPPEIKRL